MGSIMGLSTVKDFANSTTAKVAVAGAVALSAFGANAQSLESDRCGYSRGQINASLKSEGQFPIMMGNRVSDDKGINIFTSNDNGSLGYHISGDKPSVKDSTKFCVATYRNIQVNTVDNPIPPPWAADIKPSEGIDINKAYSHGYRVVFNAQSFKKISDTQIVVGKDLVVGVTPQDNGSSVWAVDSNRVPSGLFSMRDFVVTQNMQKMLVGMK